jgi:hypothetical protein
MQTFPRAARLRRAVVLLAVALLPLAACGDDTGPGADDISGSWTGTISSTAGSAQLAFAATQTGEQVTGTGTLSGGGESLALTLSGTVVESDVSLTFQSPGFEPVSFEGVLDEDTMTGTLSGSGFTGEELTLTRTR